MALKTNSTRKQSHVKEFTISETPTSCNIYMLGSNYLTFNFPCFEKTEEGRMAVVNALIDTLARFYPPSKIQQLLMDELGLDE
jgi:hypothetical protein